MPAGYTGTFLLLGRDENGNPRPIRVNADGRIPVSTDITTLENVITVAKDGGDFTTLEGALNSITASGPTNRYLIEVGPGIYNENNPLTLKQYVYIRGSGQNVTRITATNANQDLFDSANFVVLDSLSLSGVSGAGWVIDITDAHVVTFKSCVVFNCSNGLRINNNNALLSTDNVVLFALGVTLVCGYCNNAGELYINGGRVGINSTVTTVFNLDGANAITTVLDFVSFETGVTTMVYAQNDARSVFNGCSFVGMNDCFVLESGSDTRAVATSVFLAQQDAVRINNVGSDTNFVGQGLTVEDSTRYDINILSATGVVSGYGQGSVDKFNFVTGAQVVAAIVDLKEDDEGLNVIGELHGGTPEIGAEAVFWWW